MTRPFEVTLRRDSSGGKAVSETRGNRSAFSPRYRVLLLVHGYNVSEEEALRAFEKFAGAVARFDPALLRDLGIIFWPGDWRTQLLRVAAYPWRVVTARECASQLADYLGELLDPQKRPTELIIVAHSLGCRLALESLRILCANDFGRRITLVLMAAAVPLPWVYGELSWLKNRRELRILVLFSTADGVLHRVFPLGQTLAEPHFGIDQEAVGRFGRPSSGVWWRTQEMFGYGHGDYWTSQAVPRIVCLLMGRSVPRELPIRKLQSASQKSFQGTSSRHLPEQRFGLW